jgi:cell division transport system permease protein
MRIGLLGYFFKKAIENLRVNPFLSLVTLTSITISLMILGLFGLIYLNLQQLLHHWGDELRVTAFLQDTLSREEADKLRSQIVGWPGVGEVTYVSKAQALGRFREQLKEYAGVLEGLKENPLPASLELKLRPDTGGLGNIDHLASRLQHLRGVAEVQYGQRWLARIKISVDVIKLVGITVGGLILLATTFLISNTVKLTFYARQEELEIMRLVGATDFFIKAPFLIEGLLHGLGGAVLAVGALLVLLQLLFSHLHIPLGFIMMPGTILSPPLIIGFVSLGVLLGLLGSMVSLRRFLRP